jgi:hypothetical protein
MGSAGSRFIILASSSYLMFVNRRIIFLCLSSAPSFGSGSGSGGFGFYLKLKRALDLGRGFGI